MVHQQQSQQQLSQINQSILNIEVNCQYKDHEDNIMGICFKPNCEKQSRLVCFTCAISNHHEHGQYIVRLSDMQKTDNLFLRNWPNSQQAIEINEYLKLNQPEKTEKVIDEYFDRFEQQYKNQLQKTKEKIKKDLYEKLKRNQNIVKDIDRKLDDTYNLKGIKSQIYELNEGNIDSEQFERKVQDFLTGKQSQIHQIELQNLFMEKKKKIHDSFNIELLQHFFDKSLKIAEDLPSLMWPKVATCKIDNRGNVGGITSGLNQTIHKKI